MVDSSGAPIRIGRLIGVEKLMQARYQQHTPTSGDTHTNNPSINIGNVYGSVAFGGDVNTTNIYNETIEMIDKTNSISDDQKAQLKGVLKHIKDYAAPFMPIFADTVKKIIGL